MNKKLRAMALAIAFALAAVTYITFLVAYFNPSQTTLVAINNYGEADFEFIILLIAVPIGGLAAFDLLMEAGKNG